MNIDILDDELVLDEVLAAEWRCTRRTLSRYELHGLPYVMVGGRKYPALKGQSKVACGSYPASEPASRGVSAKSETPRLWTAALGMVIRLAGRSLTEIALKQARGKRLSLFIGSTIASGRLVLSMHLRMASRRSLAMEVA